MRYIIITLLLLCSIFETYAYSPIPCGYWMKRERVFFSFNGNLTGLPGVSARSFLFIYPEGYPQEGGSLYGKTNSAVYYHSKKLEGADPKSFKLWGGDTGCGMHSDGYATDQNHIYYNGKRIEDADSKSFKFLGYSIAKDQNKVYKEGFVLEGTFDIPSFEVIDEYYNKDDNALYYGKMLLPNASSKDFKKISKHHIQSNNRNYIGGVEINLNFDSFEVIHIFHEITGEICGIMMKDKTGIYYQSFHVDNNLPLNKLNFDVETFTFSKRANIFEDKNGSYRIHQLHSDNKLIVKELEK